MFKKILAYISSIFILYIIFLYVINYNYIPYFSTKFGGYKPNGYGHLNTRIKEIKNINYNLDILFLGSSHSYRGFDTRYYVNKKTFNLGSSSQSPVQTNILLKRYIDNVKPKIVIYEVYPPTFYKSQINPALDLVSNDKNDNLSLNMVLSANDIKLYNTFLIASINDFFNINKNNIEPIVKGNDYYIKGGFVESKISFADKKIHNNNTWNIDYKQIKIFEENLKLIKNNNSRIILVFAPISKSLYNSYNNNSKIDSLFNSFKVEYYNLNKLIEINDTLDLYDDHHLNKNGVKKLNLKMIEIINKKT